MQLTPGTAHADHSPAQEKKLSGRKYSEVVAAPRYAVLNESADPRHCGEDIVRQIKEKVNVIDLGIGVTGVRKLKNQKVAITCDTERDRTALKEAIVASNK